MGDASQHFRREVQSGRGRRHRARFTRIDSLVAGAVGFIILPSGGRDGHVPVVWKVGLLVEADHARSILSQ